MADSFCVEPQSPQVPGPAGPAGPAGVPYLQAVADVAMSSGLVGKKVSGGNITLCSGSASGDGDMACGIVHPAVAAAATANFYPDGSFAPVAGLPVGPVFRTSTGALTDWGSLTPTHYTQQIGISDGTGVHVRIGAEVQR